LARSSSGDLLDSSIRKTLAAFRGLGVVILIIYDVRMILSLAFRLIADDKCIQKKYGSLQVQSASEVKRTCPCAADQNGFQVACGVNLR
jgi:hypothetical protein